MIRKIGIVFLLLFVLVGFPASAVAAPQIPPTSEGPGLILPNSPFFFLDEIKQNVRILLAVRPQDRAEVYNSIAGERFAELRFMLAASNKKGIEIDLKGVSENTQASADTLAEAQFRGNDVEKLAESINTDIKRRQEGLDVLLAASTGELQTMVLGTQTSMYQSKTKVANGLGSQRKEIELKNDQNMQLETRILNKYDCSPDILNKLSQLRQRIDQLLINESKKEIRGALNTTKEPRAITIEEKKKILNAAYEKLTRAAKQCVEANTTFRAAYKELDALLKGGISTTRPTCIPRPACLDKGEPRCLLDAKNFCPPTPTCRPRPACLDATPRCLIPETSDMCPRPIK